MKAPAAIRRFSIVFFTLMLLTTCGQLWTDLDNPVDDKAANYQGYETVRDPSQVGPARASAGVVTYTPALVSTKVVGAEAYQFQISATADFASPLYTSPESASNEFLPTDCPGLSATTTYHWRVRAKTVGAWSDYTSTLATFSLSAPAAGTVAPVDASTTADTNPVLDWNDIAGAAGYEVQIADSSGGLAGATAVAAPTSQYEVPTGLHIGTWYWRIRAKNSDELWGAWSSTWCFLVTLEMVDVAGRTFAMGSASGLADEAPVHDVGVSSFKLAKYEITQSQYQAVMGANPSLFSGLGDAPSCPVERVSWFDALEFCNKLSQGEGLQPFYTLADIVRSTADGITYISSALVTVDWSKNGYRLPTEAEWEHAARGGVNSGGYTYPGSNTLDDVAWYSLNSYNAPYDAVTPHAVGTKAPNELGLYDMAGNVYEWCWDWWLDSYYADSPSIDPHGPDSGSNRIRRGGTWLQNESVCRSTSRGTANPDYANMTGGFRVARSLPVYTYTLAPTPSDAGTTSYATPLLEWVGATEATAYALQIADSSLGVLTASTVFTVSAQYQVPSNLALGTWYWRVRAKNAVGVWGAWSSTWSLSRIYAIGDTGPAGGIVFYDKGSVSDGWRYLEATLSDQSSVIQWGGTGTSISFTSTAIGSGKANTDAIVARLGSDSYAARICYDLYLGGYDDWFLPSKDELNLMYVQKGGIGGFASDFYWSSSETSSSLAWCQRFGDGAQTDLGKSNDNGFRVRAVRAF